MSNRENLHRIKQEIAARREQMEELSKFFAAHRDVQLAVPRDLAAQLEEQHDATSLEPTVLAPYAIPA